MSDPRNPWRMMLDRSKQSIQLAMSDRPRALPNLCNRRNLWILFFCESYFESVVRFPGLFDRSGGNAADQLPREDEIEQHRRENG